jgi:hypothetical protein
MSVAGCYRPFADIDAVVEKSLVSPAVTPAHFDKFIGFKVKIDIRSCKQQKTTGSKNNGVRSAIRTQPQPRQLREQ